MNINLEGINNISIFIFKIFFINLFCWFLILLGGGVFGLFPALGSVFGLVRTMKKREDVQILPFMWRFYRQNFIKLNKISFIYYSILFASFYSLSLVNVYFTNDFILKTIINFVQFMIVLALINVLPLFVQYEFTIKEYFIRSIYFTFFSLGKTLKMIFVIYISSYIFFKIPFLLLCFYFVSIVAIILHISEEKFNKIEIQYEAETHQWGFPFTLRV